MIATEKEIQEVWSKGVIVPNYNSSVWRKDACNAWIKRTEYGNRDSIYGWEIDHIIPKSKGGAESLDNKRPLQWKNNVGKQDDRLVCVVTSNGNTNIEQAQKVSQGAKWFA
jgi:hypothetical protein